MAVDGLTTLASSRGPEETMNKLEAEVKAKGMTVFARIDHAAGAASSGLSLRPTELLIFGNAKAAADAIGSDDGNRSAVEGAGVARCIGPDMAFVQRSKLAR
jgi:uncharacterized protein (DUF302 family)